jgi:thiamine biosynthesis lipoprotein
MRDPTSFPTRRDFLAVAAGAFVVAAVPLARRGRPLAARRALPTMGTTAEMVALHRDPAYAQRALDAAARELLRVEGLMTRFRPGSDVGRANRLAGREAVPISADTARVLREALRWAEATEGGFDPCLARVTDLWDVKHRHAPPDAAPLRRLAGRRLYRALEVRDEDAGHVVRIGDADAHVDLGGIAAGYGVDRAVETLRAWGVENGFVNVGGDIYALGVSEDGDPWEVGVRAPGDDPAALAGTVRLSDQAIATSGDYEQYFDHGGRRYHHILDPRTAEPRRSLAHGITVTGPACLAVDAATTACFGLERAEASALLARVAPGAAVVHVG